MRRAIAIVFLFLSLLSTTVFSYSISPPLNQSCLPDQMFALLQLKHEQQSCFHAHHDDNPFESWKNNTDCCSWTGVTCDSLSGHVIGLDLNSFGLCGSIPSTSALFHLTHLQSLILFNNSISGSISSGFNRLSDLRNLNLSKNHFEGSIPHGFDRLSSLTILDLSGNAFSGQIQENSSLFHLHNLQKLNLSYNNFEGSILDGINRLFNLTHLHLRENQFSGQIHDNNSLFHLLDLQVLDLSWNSFEGSIPHGFHRLFKLTHLDLSWNSFDGQIPSDISRMTELVSLDVSYNRGLKLRNPNLKTLIQNLSNLTVLGLSWVNMSSDNNYDWSQVVSSVLPNLEWLLLSNCSISKPVDTSLLHLHSLSGLSLDSNNLSSTIPDLLGKLPSLRELSLSSTKLYGEIPRNLFYLLPHLEFLDLFDNHLLSGCLPEFPYVNSLRLLFFDSLPPCGKFPSSIRNLKSLEVVSFSNCSLSGPISSILSPFENLTNLLYLDLSFNSLTGQIPSSSKDKFPNLYYLNLGNNFLQGPFPSSFANLTNLVSLDLSYNSLTGQIPSSFANLTKLKFLVLSYNNLSSQIPSFFKGGFSNLVTLDLGNNLLEGPIHPSLLSIPSLQYIDLSYNQLNGILDDGDHDDNFSHHSKPVGKIPISSACNGTNLRLLDLSYNKLSGVIPNKCFGHMIGNISVLFLEQNNLHGPIPASFTKGCKLQMLKLNGNQLQGNLPKSMANCIDLEELELGNNQLSGTFPFWLQSLPQLRVLILRSNKFYGPLSPKSKVSHSPCFSMLQLFDISENNFTGKLPLDYISQWKLMLDANASRLGAYLSLQNISSGHDIIDIVSKGIHLEMEMIFSTLTIINLSHNKFEGNISAEIGVLKALMEVNLSANVLTGQIPASFAQLIQLESLDLSKNSLSGEIPHQMASLTSLSFLNLSENNLTGMIPQGQQFGTFSLASYEGNVGLCGFPLSKRCGPIIERSFPPIALTLEKEEDYTIGLLDWRFMIAGYCSGVIIGVVIGHTMFWRIVGCFRLTSRMQMCKPKQRSMTIKSHG